jgi:hypothetical protein
VDVDSVVGAIGARIGGPLAARIRLDPAMLSILPLPVALVNREAEEAVTVAVDDEVATVFRINRR